MHDIPIIFELIILLIIGYYFMQPEVKYISREDYERRKLERMKHEMKRRKN